MAGLIPGVEEIADLANAGIYALRGDYTSALLSEVLQCPLQAGERSEEAGKQSQESTAENRSGRSGEQSLRRNQNRGKQGSRCRDKHRFTKAEIYEAQRYIEFVRTGNWSLKDWKGFG